MPPFATSPVFCGWVCGGSGCPRHPPAKVSLLVCFSCGCLRVQNWDIRVLRAATIPISFLSSFLAFNECAEPVGLDDGVHALWSTQTDSLSPLVFVTPPVLAAVQPGRRVRVALSVFVCVRARLLRRAAAVRCCVATPELTLEPPLWRRTGVPHACHVWCVVTRHQLWVPRGVRGSWDTPLLMFYLLSLRYSQNALRL